MESIQSLMFARFRLFRIGVDTKIVGSSEAYSPQDGGLTMSFNIFFEVDVQEMYGESKWKRNVSFVKRIKIGLDVF